MSTKTEPVKPSYVSTVELASFYDSFTLVGAIRSMCDYIEQNADALENISGVPGCIVFSRHEPEGRYVVSIETRFLSGKSLEQVRSGECRRDNTTTSKV